MQYRLSVIMNDTLHYLHEDHRYRKHWTTDAANASQWSSVSIPKLLARVSRWMTDQSVLPHTLTVEPVKETSIDWVNAFCLVEAVNPTAIDFVTTIRKHLANFTVPVNKPVVLDIHYIRGEGAQGSCLRIVGYPERVIEERDTEPYMSVYGDDLGVNVRYHHVHYDPKTQAIRLLKRKQIPVEPYFVWVNGAIVNRRGK